MVLPAKWLCSLVFCLVLPLAALVAAERIENRQLQMKDLNGETRVPFSGERASLLLFVSHDCPISNRYAGEIRRICAGAKEQGVDCFLVYPDPDVTVSTLLKHRSEFGHTGYPAIQDREHELVRMTGAQVTPEAVLVGREGAIVYRGRIDNAYVTWGKARPVVTERDLGDALEALQTGRTPEKSRTKAVGCYIPPIELHN